MILHHVLLCAFVLFCICITIYHTVIFSTWYCTISRYIILGFILLCCILPYYIISYPIMSDHIYSYGFGSFVGVED